VLKSTAKTSLLSLNILAVCLRRRLAATRWRSAMQVLAGAARATVSGNTAGTGGLFCWTH